MTSRTLTLTVLLLVLTACGSTTSDGGPSTGGSDPEATASGTPTPTPTPSRPTDPSEAAKKVRVVGEVVTDGDCVSVRDANDVTWTLAGAGTQALRVGDRVQATGTPDIRATGCNGPLITVRTMRVLG